MRERTEEELAEDQAKKDDHHKASVIHWRCLLSRLSSDSNSDPGFEDAGAVADQQSTGEGQLWNRLQAAFGYGACTIGNALAAFE